MMSCSAIKAEVEMGEVGDILSDCVCLPNKLLRVMSPAFLEVAVHLTADEK